ncbi:MAG TPA: GH25 family lysozyme [Streptosporangiaceae bacterium]|nr:GH25 family lysozyme [Streptosporangiaceae bacterium]
MAKLPRRLRVGFLVSAGLCLFAALLTTGSRQAAPAPADAARAAGRLQGSAASTGAVRGVDIASFQHAGGAIDWGKVAAAGYSFAFIKATEGSYYANPYFAADYAAARAAGLTAAAYHFANPADSSGIFQADYAANVAGYAPDGRTLPLILDIEYDPYVSLDHTNECYGLTPAAMVAWIGAFVTEVSRRTGQRPVIYTTADWWDTCTGGSTAFTSDPLWIAAYSSASPPMPAGWTGWEFWQYTSTATVPGIPGHVDVSYLTRAFVTLLASRDQSGTTGQRAQFAVSAVGGLPGQGLTFRAAGLPAGMSINPATGIISGTLPATPGSGTATVAATSASGATGSTTFAWHVHWPVRLISPDDAWSASYGPADLQLGAIDGLPGCTLSFTAAGLPPGLTMTRCGLITGWLTRAGRFNVTVTVSEATAVAGGTAAPLAAASFTWTVRPAPARGPVGTIRLAGTRRCLAARASGSVISPVLRRCGSTSPASWTTGANGTVRIDGGCLGGPGLAGSPVTLRRCDGAAAQRWADVPGTGLVNGQTGNCLQAPAGSTVAPLASACAGTASQQWILPPAPLVSGIPGRCATAVATSGGTAVTLRPCTAPRARYWTAMPDNTLRILGQCLSTGGAAGSGSPVLLGRCDADSAQQWLPFGGPLGAQFVNPASGLCLASPVAHPASATRLALEPCAASPQTSWHVS